MAETPPTGTGFGPGAASRLLAALNEPDPPQGNYAGDSPGVPGYVTLERLGDGASGTVYKVVRPGSNHPLALKIMNVRLGQDAASKRAWRELQVLESLRLPAIPQLHDFGEHGGRLFVVTDLIEGRHPDAWADERGLGRRARVELLADIADAVHTLHEQGVIHRDLKPANILITSAGRVVVLDLGLAVLVAQNVVDTLTVEGQAVGTPAFMAPEQARGEKAAVGTRADVYSLGAVGFLLLTGGTPHDVNTTVHEAIRRVGSDEPRDPRALDPSLPRPLAAVLGKAASRAPAARYPSAAAFAADLRRWLAGEPVLAAPPSPWQRAVRWAGRHPVLMTAGACMAVLAGAVVLAQIGTARFYREPTRVVVNEESGEVRLLSRMGTVIRSWQGDRWHGVPVAAIVQTPAAFGGERLFLISAPKGTDSGPAQANLCAFRLKDVAARDAMPTPVWYSGDRAPSIECPPEVRQPGDRYNTTALLVADVFTGPEYPGDEVVVAHTHEHGGLLAIRVYAAHSGAVLYETWNWGSVRSLLVSRDAVGPILFVTAISNPHSPKTLKKSDGKSDYAYTAFALRPIAGARTGFVNLRADSPDRPHPEVLWYRFIVADDPQGVLAAWDVVPKMSLRSDEWAPAGPGSVEIQINTVSLAQGNDSTAQGVGAMLVVDPGGRVVGHRSSDPYTRELGNQLPPKAWRLQAEPPWETPELYKPDGRGAIKRWP